MLVQHLDLVEVETQRHITGALIASQAELVAEQRKRVRVHARSQAAGGVSRP